MNEIRITRRREARPAAEFLEVRSLLSAGLDPGFAGGSIDRLNVSDLGALPNSSDVVSQFELPGGKTLVVARGATLTTSAAGGVLFGPLFARLNPDGTPDSTFGSNGVLSAAPSSGNTHGYPDSFNITASALQGDGKVLLFGDAGLRAAGRTIQELVDRANPDGSLDTTFHYGGPTSGIDIAGAGMAVTPSGKIYLAVNAFVTGNFGTVQPTLYRLNSDGSLDTTFGSGGSGKVTINVTFPKAFDNLAPGLRTQGELPLIIVNDGGPVGSLYRFLPDGSPDPAFGTAGVATFDTSINSASTLLPQLLSIDPKGRIVVAGLTTDVNTSPRKIAIARLDANGHADPSFGSGGRVAVGFGQRGFGYLDLVPEAVGFTPDGKITIAAAVAAQDFRSDVGVIRLNEDGSPDATVGPGGVVIAPVELFKKDPYTVDDLGRLFPNAGGDRVLIDSQGRAILARIGNDATVGEQVVVARVAPVLPTPPVVIVPTVTTVVPTVFRKHITGFVVSFRTPMNPSAGQLAAYRLVSAGRDGKFGTRHDRTLPLGSAHYDAAANVVRISLRHALARNSTYRLTAFAAALTDLAGRHPAKDFTFDFQGKV